MGQLAAYLELPFWGVHYAGGTHMTGLCMQGLHYEHYFEGNAHTSPITLVVCLSCAHRIVRTPMRRMACSINLHAPADQVAQQPGQ